MHRLLVMTVGKTHSGKSTFGQMLANRLDGACVIDQDNHAEFVNTYYKALLPEHGPNLLKYSVSETIIDYAITQTDLHVILCNAFRSRVGRSNLLGKFRGYGFTTVLVYFDIPDEVLAARVATTARSTAIFRSASSFAEALARQQAETGKGDVTAPEVGEADFFFSLGSSQAVHSVVDKILEITFQDVG